MPAIKKTTISDYSLTITNEQLLEAIREKFGVPNDVIPDAHVIVFTPQGERSAYSGPRIDMRCSGLELKWSLQE